MGMRFKVRNAGMYIKQISWYGIQYVLLTIALRKGIITTFRNNIEILGQRSTELIKSWLSNAISYE